MSDNYTLYSNLRNEEIDRLIDSAIISQGHIQIAKAFKACYPNKFVCTTVKNNPWYINDETGWKHMSGNIELLLHINEKFIPVLEHVQTNLAAQISKSRDLNFKDKGELKLNFVGELIKKLSRYHFKQALCSELKIHYMNPNFNMLR